MCTLLVLVSCVHCTVGWVDFALFLILCKVMLFAAPLGELPFFNFGSKTSECYTFKGPYFQKQIQGAKHKNRFFWKNVFFTVLPILCLRKLNLI